MRFFILFSSFFPPPSNLTFPLVHLDHAFFAFLDVLFNLYPILIESKGTITLCQSISEPQMKYILDQN